MTNTTEHAALSHRCPFCRADPGQPCRSHRGLGSETDLHSRRIALTRPPHPPTRVNALCCTCGNLRTVSVDYHRWQDPEHDESPRGKAAGWVRTQSLKCAACGQRTRHAVLRPADVARDVVEQIQLIALGDDDHGKYPWSNEYIARIRREYRALHPRNPYLRHRYWTREATQAWNSGHKQVTALCGEQITLKSDPGQPSEKYEKPGFLVAEQFSDTEYEDPETGLSWIDMDCVDCCRVSNNRHWAAQRQRMERLLAHLAYRPELVQDSDLVALVTCLEQIVEQARVAGLYRKTQR